MNFAHGQLYMLGAFIAWYAMTRLGLSYPLAIVVAALVLALLGALMQGAMMRLVMTQNLTSLMIVTLGLGYVIQGGSALIFGGNPHTFPGTLVRAKIDLGPLWFTWQDVLVLVVTLVLYGAVWWFTQKTRYGSVIRAVAEDSKLAGLFGINAQVVYLCVFMFECAAVAIGAALVAPRSPILTSMGFNEVIMTFVVVVVGGIGSIGGALAAGLGLGLVHRVLRRVCRACLHHRGRLCPDAHIAGGPPARDWRPNDRDREPHHRRRCRSLRAAAIVVLIVVGFFLPRLLGGGSVAYSTLTTIAIFAVMCYGVDLVLSYLGEVSLGHTLFWAIGGYAAANLSVKYGLNGWGTALAAVAFCRRSRRCSSAW